MTFGAVFPRVFRPAFGPGLAQGSQTIVVLNPSKDTWLDDGTAARKTYNYGAITTMGYGDTSAKTYSYLFTFDLSSIPGVATCVSAILSLYNVFLRTSDRSGSLYQLASANADYGEGAQNGALGGVGEASWNYKDQGSATAWAGSAGAETAGTDYINTILGTVSYTANTPEHTELQTTLNASGIAAIQAAFGSAFTFKVRDAVGLTIGFYAREDASYKPKLTITYT